MQWELALLLLLAGLISLWLMVKVARSERTKLDKFGAFLLLAVPLVGPLLYWFVYNDLPAQHKRLQNRGPRGELTHKWIAIKPVLEDGLAADKDGEANDNGEQTGR